MSGPPAESVAVVRSRNRAPSVAAPVPEAPHVFITTVVWEPLFVDDEMQLVVTVAPLESRATVTTLEIVTLEGRPSAHSMMYDGPSSPVFVSDAKFASCRSLR
jgi:hypothetical protein